jgi:hypothetical protein
MTIQEAAYKLLTEKEKPLSSKELAKIALERQMVSSAAQDPVASHAQTIEKNIRDGVYNNPKLVFVHAGAQGRLIGLPGWNSNVPEAKETLSKLIEIKAKIPSELFDKIKLAEQAKLKNDFDETVSLLLTKGLSIVAADIKKGLMTQLDSLNSL